jgi:hypothetical protein
MGPSVIPAKQSVTYSLFVSLFRLDLDNGLKISPNKSRENPVEYQAKAKRVKGVGNYLT